MASTIVTKNSSTASAVPVSGDLTQGELAVNVTDKKLYTKDSGGTVVKLVGGLGNQEANAVAITGGSINGTTVGATTASTGAFTTLSASSTTTLSGGTANGVAYLNGSKVVTTGSALTFDGTTLTTTGKFGITGSGSVPTSTAIEIGTNGAGSRLLFNVPTGGEHNFNVNGSLASWVNATSSGWYISGSEAMRLTSTGLGIGTSSPSYKLHVNGYVYSGSGFVLLSQASGGGNIYEASGNTGINIGTTSNTLEFSTSGSTRMRLDSSGNLGLGVTPSAYAGGKSLTVASVNGLLAVNAGSSGGDYGLVGYNIGFTSTSGSYKYQVTDTASALRFGAGGFQFYTAPSGTAGNAITFTQAMTLDASGNLLVGATSLAFSEKFQMYGNYAVFNNASYTGFIGQGSSLGTATASDFAIRSSNALAFLTGGATERARIDSSGNLGIGTTSPASRLTLNTASGENTLTYALAGSVKAYIGVSAGAGQIIDNSAANDYCIRSAANILFAPNGQYEKMRLDTSGNLLVGTTTQRGKITVESASGNCRAVNVLTGTSIMDQFYFNGTATGNISTNGVSASYNTSSDYRLKEDIQPMTGALAKVAALKPVTYKWKADGSDGEGFIAHELAEVCPHAVTGEKDAVDENGNPVYQGIDTSFLVATLTAALQEAVAEINQLKADVAALKGN